MMAILGMSIDDVEEEINLLPKKEICEIANDNSNTQVVVSGKKKVIEILNENLKKKKKKRILLPVSAPFHCSLMKKAAESMKDKIEEAERVFCRFNMEFENMETQKRVCTGNIAHCS